MASTVNIEPLTAEDWESKKSFAKEEWLLTLLAVIELHATFLEFNFVNQIRALPNASYQRSDARSSPSGHPLTLHLTPTATANILVSSILPPLSSSTPFAKLSPEAEVIVAPKVRPHLPIEARPGSWSGASASQRSTESRSTSSRQRANGAPGNPRKPVLLRGIDANVCASWMLHGTEMDPHTLSICLDSDLLVGNTFAGVNHVCVSLVQAAATQIPIDAPNLQKLRDLENGEAGRAAGKVVATIHPWHEAPDSDQALLSSMLCQVLGVQTMSGGLVKVEPAPPPLAASGIRNFQIFPFLPRSTRAPDTVQFGGSSRSAREAAAAMIKTMYGAKNTRESNLFNGPLTDGMVLPKPSSAEEWSSWEGGQLMIDSSSRTEGGRHNIRWVDCRDVNMSVEIRSEISNPLELQKSSQLHTESLSTVPLKLVGVDKLVSRLISALLHQSSVLLNGGLGAGKTSLTCAILHQLRRDHLFHVSYFPCKKAVTDEARISTIRDTLTRAFMTAAWGTKLGGRAAIVLDDLDRLCPSETELQVGGENGRSRQLSEMICSLARQHCGAGSGVVLLATAQAKEALNDVIVGGHVAREIVDLKAPDKEQRRRILEYLAQELESFNEANERRQFSPAGSDSGWMADSSPQQSRPITSEGIDPEETSQLDFLDLAGKTDGFMPGDLGLLLDRAESEARIRLLAMANPDAPVHLHEEDFGRALRGFTPASLRNVNLQSSTTKFSSIGGLKDTRKILLETLQYPTTFAPIFAQCPLRLRSGLLLYGYPGCGKTLLASAVAGECGLNFISVKGPEILNKYIGASEKSIRDLFDRAEAARPCVLFFDEFDSIAPKRGHDSTGVTDRVVNQLLTQMDGAEGLSGVYVLAATSRPDLIDPALLRPGRLDKSLLCDMPSYEDRLDILRALSSGLKLSPQIVSQKSSANNLSDIAIRTEGYSGADLQAVVYNAQLEAIHDVLDNVKGVNGSVNGILAGKSKRSAIGSTTRTLFHFPFDETEDSEKVGSQASLDMSRSRQAARNAELLAKLESAKRARRKQRAQMRTSAGVNIDQKQTNGGTTAHESAEVVIEWKHVAASLAATRRSISAVERQKLEKIYREFVGARKGELPNGQASMQIGGRSSLM